MVRLSERILNISESATLAVDAKAKALLGDGRPVIGFAAGEPDFPTPAHIVEAAIVAARDPRNHRYSPTGGLAELKHAIIAKTDRDTGYHVAPSQVLVTNGGKQAVYHTFAAILNPGDGVLLPTPHWTTYPEAIRLAGGIDQQVLTTAENDFLPNLADLEAARTAQTTAILICSPSNPTGTVYPGELLREIGQWAHEHKLWVITDEIYEHFTYDDATMVSLPVLVPELADQCIVLNGVAKSYAMTGWRVGWMIGPTDVIKAATNLQSHTTSNVANISQRAAIAALTGGLDEVLMMNQAFDRRRQRMVTMLNAIDGITCPTPRGAFYCYPEVTGLLGRNLHGTPATTSAELAEIILTEAEVALVPSEAFGPSGHLRLSCALADDQLVEGLTRIQDFFAKAG